MSSPLLHSSTVQRIGPQFAPDMNRDMVVFQAIAHNGLRMVLAGAVWGLFPVAVAMAQPSNEVPLPNPQSRPSLENYSLPPGPGQTSDQNVLQGPVDEEIIFARPPVVTPRAAPARAPAESSTATAEPAAAERGNGQAEPPVRQAPRRPDIAAETPSLETEPTSVNPVTVTDERPAAPDTPTTEIDAIPAPPEARGELVSPSAAHDWLLLLVAALFFALLAATYLWRAHRAPSKQPAATKAIGVKTSQTGPPVKLRQPLQPAPVIAIGFQPRSANATLFNAVVGFELTLSNHGDEILTGIRVHGIMVQAEEQDSFDPLATDLSPLHAVPSLETGETEKIVTEFRIPLSGIDPIIFRSQALFVPLVQISIEFTDGGGFQHFQTAAYLVGLEHQPPRPKLAPFRLDLGPRSFAPLGHRPFAVG